jgi:hypothetical protein
MTTHKTDPSVCHMKFRLSAISSHWFHELKQICIFYKQNATLYSLKGYVLTLLLLFSTMIALPTWYGSGMVHMAQLFSPQVL